MSATSQSVIVDGYNVIYTDERMRRAACRDLERARKMLIDLLRAYVRERGIRMTVVFDGRGGVVEAESIVPGKLQALYSPSGQTADDLILETLRQSGRPRSYIVITSDMTDIGREARGMGATVIGSKRYLDRIAAASRIPSDERPEAADTEDVGDAEYWLRRFDESGKEE